MKNSVPVWLYRCVWKRSGGSGFRSILIQTLKSLPAVCSGGRNSNLRAPLGYCHVRVPSRHRTYTGVTPRSAFSVNPLEKKRKILISNVLLIMTNENVHDLAGFWDIIDGTILLLVGKVFLENRTYRYMTKIYQSLSLALSVRNYEN